MRIRLLKAVVRTALEEVTKAVLDPVKGPLFAVILALVPTAIVWLRSGQGFLLSTHAVPVWALSVGLGLVIFGGYWLVRQHLQFRRSRRRLGRFESHGLEWVLTADFFANYQHLLLAETSFPYLNGMIRGLFCRGCGRDASWVFEL